MAAFLRMPPWRTGSASHIDPLSADLVGGQSAACVGQRGHYQGMGWRLMQSSPEKGEDRLAAVVFWLSMEEGVGCSGSRGRRRIRCGCGGRSWC
jgi:hypothetical protein